MKALRACLLAASIALAASPAMAEVGVTDNEILIGMFSPLSGPVASFGTDTLYAAKLWYDEINKKGGIHGRKIRVLVEDDKCTPTDLLAVVKKYVTIDKVFMVHGGSCNAVLAAQEYVTREQVPFAMINASGDAAVFPATRYVFGAFGGTQRTVASTMVSFVAKELKAKKVAMIIHDDDYGTNNLAAAGPVLKKYGIELVVVEKLSARATDVTSTMLNVKAANPDVILATAYPAPAVLLAQKRYELGIKQPLVQSVSGVPFPDVFAKNVGDNAALKDFYYGTPLNDLTNGPKQQKWIAMYKAAYPDKQNVSAFMAYGFPSAMAITAALEKAGRDLTREKFIDAMETVNIDTGILAGPIVLTKNRHDGHRGSNFVKFDGVNHTLMPGPWLNEADGD